MSERLAKRPKMDEGSSNEVQRKSTSPKPICNLNTHKFSEIVETAAFVDKTLFIKAFLQDMSVVVMLAPRKFGKSTNMDMVKEFLTGNKKLFEDHQLKIWKDERNFFNKYCEKNPIIHVDFKRVGGTTEDEILGSLKEVIKLAFDDHKYLIKVDGENYSWSDEKLEETGPIGVFEKYWMNPENLSRFCVKIGLKHLSWLLNVYYEKPVYVFIDNYDGPIMRAITETYLEERVLEGTINLLGDLMSNLLKSNDHMEKALINSSLCFTTDPNNIQYYECLNDPKFSPYFGFTDEEVNILFERHEFVNLKSDEVQKWYNGYKLPYTNDYTIYNSYSVLRYLEKSKEINKPQFDTYWVDSGIVTADLKELFTDSQIEKRLEYLIDGEEVEISRYKSDFFGFYCNDIMTLQRMIHHQEVSVYGPYLFLRFLTVNGYLNVVRTDTDTTTIVAPNNEIKNLLKKYCYSAELFLNKYQLSPQNIRNYVDALESLLQQRNQNSFIEFAKTVSELFDGATMPQFMDDFHSILFAFTYNIKLFAVQSELSVQRTRRGTGRGILVILNEVAMILQLKFKYDSSEEAHTEILTEGYVTAFDDYRNVTVKILLGVHMTEQRKVSLTYTVDDSLKQTVTSND